MQYVMDMTMEATKASFALNDLRFVRYVCGCLCKKYGQFSYAIVRVNRGKAFVGYGIRNGATGRLLTVKQVLRVAGDRGIPDGAQAGG